jgi:hypothetical protein
MTTKFQRACGRATLRLRFMHQARQHEVSSNSQIKYGPRKNMNKCTYARCVYRLFFVQHALMAVAIIIVVAHTDIWNHNKTVKMYNSTTQFLLRTSQTYYAVTRSQFYNTFDIFFVQTECFSYTDWSKSLCAPDDYNTGRYK